MSKLQGALLVVPRGQETTKMHYINQAFRPVNRAQLDLPWLSWLSLGLFCPSIIELGLSHTT